MSEVAWQRGRRSEPAVVVEIEHLATDRLERRVRSRDFFRVGKSTVAVVEIELGWREHVG